MPLMRYVGKRDGEDAFAAAPAKLIGGRPGEAGQLQIGDATYLLNLEHLEEAPRKLDVPRDAPWPEAHFPMMRYRGKLDAGRRVRGSPREARRPRMGRLQIGNATYMLDFEYLEDARTDPATFDPDQDGPPHPIDVLRDPPQPESRGEIS